MLRTGLPGTLPLYFWLFLLTFFHAPRLLQFVVGLPRRATIVTSLLCIGAILTLYSWGLYDTYRQIAETLGCVSAFSFFLLFTKFFLDAPSRRWISFLSSISFELYLVHHVISFGRYSVVGWVGNPIFAFILLLLISISLAYVLYSVKRIG